MAVVINADECIGCGACEGACPQGVIAVDGVAELTDEDGCVDCGACTSACPVGCIDFA